MAKSLARQTILSVMWTSSTGLFRIVILFGRSVLLARLLELETYGTFGYASAIIGLSATTTNLGLDGAFLNRSVETADETHAAAIHFTLRTVAALIWIAVVVSVVLFWADGLLRVALLVIAITTFFTGLTRTSQLMLVRRVVHRRLAIFQSLEALISTAVALSLAWGGYELSALLAVEVVNMLLSIILFIVWRPVWRPKIVWDRATMRHFLQFGRRTFAAKLLAMFVNRADDLWIGRFLGDTPLALYQRAYTFANYPRRVVADPVAAVSSGTYAALHGDRQQLSQAFFRTNALLVRTGFLLGGGFFLIAPEFIGILLGAKWLPMLPLFQLMLIYTLLEPLDSTLSSLFVAVGHPEQLVYIKLLQMVTLLSGLFVAGTLYGAVGVAITIDVMLLVGIIAFMWQARKHIDFSVKSLFLVPTVAIVVALSAGLFVAQLTAFPDWLNATIRLSTYTLLYTLILGLFEREQLRRIGQLVSSKLRRKA